MLQNRYNWRPSEVFCKMTPNPIIKLSGVFIWVLRFPSLHSYKPFVFSFPEEFETCHYDFKILFTPNEKCPGILKKIQQQRGPKANISIFNSNVNFKSGIAAKWLTVPTSQLSYVCINFIWSISSPRGGCSRMKNVFVMYTQKREIIQKWK